MMQENGRTFGPKQRPKAFRHRLGPKAQAFDGIEGIKVSGQSGEGKDRSRVVLRRVREEDFAPGSLRKVCNRGFSKTIIRARSGNR